jgi:predicted PurR-regulated permease PerM
MILTRAQRAIIFNIFMAVAGVCLFLYLIIALKELILPMVVGALLAYLCKPLLNSFRYHWLPDGIRIFCLISFFVGFLFSATWMIRSSLPDEVKTIELLIRIQYKLNEKVDHYLQAEKPKEERSFSAKILDEQFSPLIADLNSYLALNSTQQKQLQEFYEQKLISEKYYQFFLKNINHKEKEMETQREVSSTISDGKKNSFELARILDVFSIWIVMPLVFVFLLFDKGEIYRSFVQFVPNRYFELTLTVFEQVNLAIGKYLRGSLLECLLVGLTMFAGLFLIGVDFQAAFLISLIGGIVSAIPFLGTLVGMVVGIAYAMIAENATPLIPYMTSDDLMLGVLVVMIVTHFLDNMIFQPMVVGSAVDLHPLVVVIGVIGGSILFGFTGILMAIPVIVVLKVSLETLFKGLKDYYII